MAILQIKDSKYYTDEQVKKSFSYFKMMWQLKSPNDGDCFDIECTDCDNYLICQFLVDLVTEQFKILKQRGITDGL